MTTIRLALVEDDDEIRASMEMFLSLSEDLTVVGSYSMAEELMEIFPDLDIDVVLMDISLPGITGIECVARLKPLRSEVQFLMCTVHEDQDRTFAALCAGATGYILKNSTPQKLIEAIHEIHHGGSPMSAQIARYVIKNFQGQSLKSDLLDALTPREQELVQALARGYQYKEIAEKMSISLETVRTYVRKIYEKLQVHSRTDALNKVFPGKIL